MFGTYRSSFPEMFLGKGVVQQIYRITSIPKYDFNKDAKQLY